MAALAFHYNALITWAAKVYLDTSESSTYTVCPENINTASLLGKSLFSDGLFCSLFSMEMRRCCTFPRVLQAKDVFSSHNTVDSSRIVLWLRTIATTSTSWSKNCRLKHRRPVVRVDVSTPPRRSPRCGTLMHPLTFRVTGWTWSMFLAWSEGYAHPSAHRPYRPGNLKTIVHVWSVKITCSHHVLSPPIFLTPFISVSAGISYCASTVYVSMHMLHIQAHSWDWGHGRCIFWEIFGSFRNLAGVKNWIFYSVSWSCTLSI